MQLEFEFLSVSNKLPSNRRVIFAVEVTQTILHALQVVAKEIETKEEYEGRTNVTVNIINVNDNSPSFERMVYIFPVYENISTEKVVGRVKVLICNRLRSNYFSKFTTNTSYKIHQIILSYCVCNLQPLRSRRPIFLVLDRSK